LVSIIIVTFNGVQFLKPCLASLCFQDLSGYEVIVVDNGSTDATADFIKQHYPQVRIIENKKNIGACAARNQGIALSSGEWVLTLDCDVVLERDFLGVLQNKVQSFSSEVGVIAPKILRTDKKTIYSCGIALSWTRRFYDIGHNTHNNGAFSTRREVFGACCAAALYRRSMLEAIKDRWGYFDERFFFMVEDVDLAWRARRKQWKAYFSPELVCYHSGGSAGYDKRTKQFLCLRNRFYTIAKNEGLVRYGRKILPVVFYDLPRTAYCVLTGRVFFNEKGSCS